MAEAAHTYLRTHDLSAEHMLIDLGAATADVHSDTPVGQDKGGVTLVRQSGLSVVLTHLHTGGRLEEHAAPGPVTVQVLDGRVRMQIGDATVEAEAGRLVAFDAKVRHAVEALQDSTLLITLASPAN